MENGPNHHTQFVAPFAATAVERDANEFIETFQTRSEQHENLKHIILLNCSQRISQL